MSTRQPSAITPSTVQLFTGSPSSRTTHAPQFDVSQPQCVPVSPNVSRRRWTSSTRGSTSAVRGLAVDGHGDVHSDLLPSRPGDRRSQRPFRQFAGEVALVVRRPALVGTRVAVLGGDRRRRSDRLLAGGAAAQRLLGGRAAELLGTDRRRVRCRPRLTVSPSSHTQAPAAATAQSPARRSTLR